MTVGQQYKILAELGAGGMGIVYHAVDLMLEREVAIKKLRSEFSQSAEVAERFRREAKIQARLNHPRLAHLYSFFKEGDAFYIVMEFVAGTPLSHLLLLPWQQALPVFVQILDSLEYAHSLDVMHRDIKPDNIMVSPRGEVKVMDFGIAHVLGSVRQTREKSIVGTLEYISPEQISGKEIGPWSDIYSLGVLLFEFISGRLPFEVEGEFALLQSHLQTEPPLLSSVTPGVPAFLDEAVTRAMAKAPADRFASCRAMADFLRQAAPEVFAAPADSFPRIVRQDEVDRCIRRIDALLNGDEIDLAARVLEEALEDYPGQSKLAACETRLKEKKARGVLKTDERDEHVQGVLEKAAALDAAEDFAAARDLIDAALKRYPRVPALSIANAYLVKQGR